MSFELRCCISPNAAQPAGRFTNEMNVQANRMRGFTALAKG